MMRALLVALCLAWAWLLPPATAGAQDAQAMIKARASVVSVLPLWPGRPPMQPSLKGLAWSWAMVRGWSLQIMFSARVRRPAGDGA
jgi:hypothetical protein